MSGAVKRDFQITSLKTIHEDPKFTIKIGEGVTDGKTSKFCRLERPVVVFIVPISPTGRTVLLTQFRFPVEKEVWEFPAGHTEDGEDHDQSAIRELRQETGLVVSRVTLVGQFYGMPTVSTSVYKVYVAPVTDDQLDRIKPPTDEDEITSVHVVPMSKVSAMIADGILDSGTTMATLAKIHAWQANLANLSNPEPL